MEILSSEECRFYQFFTQERAYFGLSGRVARTRPGTDPSRCPERNRDANTRGHGRRGQWPADLLRVPKRRPRESHPGPDEAPASGTACDISRIGTPHAARATARPWPNLTRMVPRPPAQDSVCIANSET